MAIYYGDGSNSNAGRLIKVHKGQYATTTSSSSTQITVFDVNITPQAAGNWFYITHRIAVSHGPSQSLYTQYLIDNNYVAGRSGGGTHSSVSSSIFMEPYGNSHSSNAQYDMYTGDYLHIQSSSSAFNFKVRTRCQGGTQYINYAYGYNDAQRGYPMSTYTIMEMEPS